MSDTFTHRRFRYCLPGGLLIAVVLGLGTFALPGPRAVLDVFPGGDIQAALEELAARPHKGTVRVHAGTYRPAAPGQAFLFFNARHDGITLEAVGEVVLTAANPKIADPNAPSYPAVVNHVVYFGDGVSAATTLRGFKITGANGFISGPSDLLSVHTADELERSASYRTLADSPIESCRRLKKTHYFYADGGGILIYGRSYPTIERVEISGNYSSVCAGGVSVQNHNEGSGDTVRFRDCVFRDNRAAVAGSGVDVLTAGSRVAFENCLFVGNLSNDGIDANGGPGYAALTVFPGARVTVNRCTFTGNRNGVDDRGRGSIYRKSIFWHNDRKGGTCAQINYELAIRAAEGVSRCLIDGETVDLLGTVSGADNAFAPPDPRFDQNYRPHNKAYRGIGFRPVR
jgi:hypothetical protein